MTTTDTAQDGQHARERWNPHGHPEIIHRCPARGGYLMPCCGQTPLEVPRWHQLTRDPAMELREAARGLRELASAATPGRWHHMCMGSEGCAVLNDGHLRERRHVAFSGRKEWEADHADAEYVASMPPSVALAVADWLDRFADPVYCYGPVEYDAALNIARAYLGSE